MHDCGTGAINSRCVSVSFTCSLGRFSRAVVFSAAAVRLLAARRLSRLSDRSALRRSSVGAPPTQGHPFHEGPIVSLCLNAAGTLALTGGEDASARVTNLATGKARTQSMMATSHFACCQAGS